jgi:peptidoglycan/LPS O-acetylase OafA/YrhL
MVLPANFSLIPPAVVLHIARNGYYGVTIFFVISGFLITSGILTRYGSFAAMQPRQFYLARFARIAPLLIATVAALTILHLTGVAGFVAAPTLSIWQALWAALTFQFNWYYLAGANTGLLPWGPLWSLSIEEMFYLFLPVACIALRKTGVIVAGLLILIVQAPGARSGWVGIYQWAGCADAIAMGCLAAILAHHAKSVSPSLRLLPWSGLALIVWQYLCYPVTEFYVYGPSIIALCAAMFLFGASTMKSAPRIFMPLEYMGRRSYEIYLIHVPLLVLMKMWIGTWSATHPDATLVLFFVAVAALGEMIGLTLTERAQKLVLSLSILETKPSAALGLGRSPLL